MAKKIVVISDVHGDIAKVRRIMPIINSSDFFVFCGDGLNDIMSIRGEITVPMVCVKGNNDWYTPVDETACVNIGQARILVTHGHKQGVKRGLDGLISAAKLKQCDLVFFGHTHSPFDSVREGIHLINPGAISGYGFYAIVVGDGKAFTCTHEVVR